MDRKFNCSQCNNEHRRKDYLLIHMKSAHPVINKDNSSRTSVSQCQDNSIDPVKDFCLDDYVNSTPVPTPGTSELAFSTGSSDNTDKFMFFQQLTYHHKGQGHPGEADHGVNRQISACALCGLLCGTSGLDMSSDQSPCTPLMIPTQTRQVAFEGPEEIPCYYTSEFRAKFLEFNGGVEPPNTTPVWSPEDPLPPPTSEKFWGNLSTPDPTFQ